MENVKSRRSLYSECVQRFSYVFHLLSLKCRTGLHAGQTESDMNY